MKETKSLEMSTQQMITAAARRGITCRVINHEHNVIELQQGTHIEIVKQASITRLDSFLAAELMTHKPLTKQILRTAGISCPAGGHFYASDAAIGFARGEGRGARGATGGEANRHKLWAGHFLYNGGGSTAA